MDLPNITSVFRRDGVALLPALLTREEMSWFVDWTDAIFGAQSATTLQQHHGVIGWQGLQPPDTSPILRAEKVASGIIGRPVTFMPQSAALRRHGPAWSRPRSAVPWHRDRGVTGTRDIADAVNIWLPLRGTGMFVPRLEFLAGSHAIMRDVPPNTWSEGTELLLDDWLAEHLGGCSRITPSLRPGDALIFHHDTIHRTAWRGPSRGRTSLELRFAVL